MPRGNTRAAFGVPCAFLERQVAKANQEHQQAQKRACHRKHEYEELETYQQMRNSGRINFERLERALEVYFEIEGQKPDPFRLGYLQERLMHEIIMTCLRVLYGDDLLVNMHDIEKRFAVRDLRNVTAILYPRRSGKTKTQTIAAAALLVSQPTCSIMCYNIGSRQAREWLKEVSDAVNVFRGTEFDWKLERVDSREFLVIQTMARQI